MYHQLEPRGGALSLGAEGDRRYVVAEDAFRRQLAWLETAQLRGVDVSTALDGDAAGTAVAITFDDGSATDLTVAAPLLAEAGFGATFYVVVGSLGARGRLSPAQVRELHGHGFEVGCHSMTHPYLTDLWGAELRTEVVESKDRLEQVLGGRVDHFSCPGGRWNPRVARLARLAGYRSVATSRIGTNPPRADHYRLKRVAILRAMGLDDFGPLCRGTLYRLRAQQQVLDAAKVIVGNFAYERVRALLLSRR
jgi:peptidoglycan/xylan/chitin deacetylase (PgdA/CDA1 family)